MSRTTSIAMSTGLIGLGALAWSIACRPLVGNPDLNAPLNPLGINGSPYGEVFAMAMQVPIDTEFHGVLGSGPAHHHADGEACDSCKPEKSADAGSPFQDLLTSLEKATVTRTNPKAASEAHKRYLRRQIEDLRAQLARYAEALEEDLASGREKVAARTREGIRMEQTFTDGSHALTEALKDRPECRDLMAQLKSTDGPRETPEQPWTNASGRVVS